MIVLKELDPHTKEVAEVYNEYYRQLAVFKMEVPPPLAVIDPKQDKKRFRYWENILKDIKKVDVPIDIYIRAQFYYFYNAFSRAPEPKNLFLRDTSVNAEKRVDIFLVDMELNKWDRNKDIVGKSPPYEPVDMEYRIRSGQAALERLMKAWEMDEETALSIFAHDKTYPYFFRKEFLEQNETYKRLKAKGILSLPLRNQKTEQTA